MHEGAARACDARAVTARARWAGAVSLARWPRARPLDGAADGSTASPPDSPVDATRIMAVAPCADEAAYVSTGDRKDVVFPSPGVFAYFCGIHGGLDDGSTMAGVV